MVNDEKVRLIHFGRTVHIPLQSLQKIIDGICAEHADNEHRSLLDLYVLHYDSEEREKARRQQEMIVSQITKGDV